MVGNNSTTGNKSPLQKSLDYESLQADNDTLRERLARLEYQCREANDALCTVQGLSWGKITETERVKIKRAIAILHGKVYEQAIAAAKEE